jgi:magnesium chelatase family protein
MLAHVTSAAVVGIEASPIDVEVDVGQGLPGCNIVGLPDAGVKEGRIRIRGALENCGARMPQRRVTVNLAPADLRKDGAAFDVPIAVGILAANGDVPEGAARGAVMLGELALDGAVRPVRGVLPIAAWARAAGKRRLFVPAANAAEAAVAAEGVEVHAVAHLQELVALLRGEPGRSPSGRRPEFARGLEGQGQSEAVGAPDLSDIRGQEVARRALEIAAAGGHNLLFVGPPGSGKTMLARRLPAILPALSFAEALETTMVYSVAGVLGDRSLLAQRPFRAPHHTVSVAGLAGGGPLVRPGEISLAHNGVLFLDELLEFSRPALEILRQPLEERSIAIVRARRSVAFPADFMLVAATNPCPCGHLGNRVRTCTCSLAAIAAYRGRLSGPLLDRIDMHVEVPALGYQELAAREPGEASATVRERVERARGFALGRGPRPNGRLGKRELDEHAAVDAAGHRLLERAVERLGLSARALDRVRRVARTIADLEGASTVAGPHVAEALQYRVLDRPIE